MQERRLRGQVMAGVRRVVAYGSPAANGDHIPVD